jgi:hypothetical protein
MFFLFFLFSFIFGLGLSLEILILSGRIGCNFLALSNFLFTLNRGIFLLVVVLFKSFINELLVFSVANNEITNKNIEMDKVSTEGILFGVLFITSFII